MTNIILNLLGLILITFSLIGYGTIVKNLNRNYDLFFVIIVGYFIIGFITLIIHFFYKINDIISLIIIFLGLCLLFVSKFNILKKKTIYSFVCLIFFSFILLGFSNHPIDANMYHHPYVSYLKSEKIIFAIANIEFRFGHISLLQYVQASLTNNIFGPLTLSSLNIIFYTFFLLFCFETLSNKKENKFIFLTVLLISSFLLIKMGRYREFGNDLIPFLVSFYFLIKLIKEKMLNTSELQSTYFLYFPLYSSFMLTHKLSYIFSSLIFFLVCSKSKLKFTISNKYLISIFIGFIFVWFIKNYIETSCLIYPLIQTCIKSSGWYLTGMADPEKAMWLSEIWAKGFIDHPDWKNLDLNNYSKKFNWLSVWLNNHFIKILEKLSPIFLMIFVVSIYIFLSINKREQDKFFSQIKLGQLVFALLLVSIGLTIWFLKSPLFRYGSFYIVGFVILSYLIIAYKFINKVNQNKLIKLRILFVFAFIFFVSKNINRQIHSENDILPLTKPPINNYNFLFHEPKILKPKTGSCYYTDFICSHEIPANTKIIKKRKYYLIN